MPARNTVEIIMKATDNASGVMRSLATDASGIGEKLEVAGARIQSGIAPIAGLFQNAIGDAMEFQTSMTNVGSVLGKNKTQMQQMSDEILKLGGNSVQGPQEVARAFYDIVGGVQDASSHMPMIKQAIDLATAGNANLEGTAKALISVANSYGVTATGITEVADIITQTVAKGVGTMDEFGAALPQVTNIASKVGISLSDVASAMAFMTTKGTPAAQAATQLSSMITTLLNPTTDVAKAINKLGYESGEALIKGEGLTGAYEKLAENNGGSLSGLITNVEALRGASTLAGDGFKKFDESFQGVVVTADNAAFGFETFNDRAQKAFTGATAAAKAIQLDSPAAQVALLNSKAQELSISVGNALTPAIGDLATKLTPVVGSFIDWVNQNPLVIQAIALLVGGAVVLGVTLSLLGGIVTAGTALWGGLQLAVSGAGLVMMVANAFWAFGGIVLTGVATALGLGTAGFGSLAGAATASLVPLAAMLAPILAVTAALATMGAAAAKALEFIGQVQAAGTNAAIVTGMVQSGQITQGQMDAGFAGAMANEQATNSGFNALLDIASALNPAAGAVIGQMGGGMTGGDVKERYPVVVGEAGPEVIVPRHNGTIIPNNQLGGGQYNITVNVPESVATNSVAMSNLNTYGDKVAMELARRGG